MSCLIATVCWAEPQVYRYQVIERVPHDGERFTQGFELDGDWFFESSGRYGLSYLTRYHRDDPAKAERADLPEELFAEGLTLIGERIYLLSWRAGIARVYGKESLRLLKTIPYSGEGWGLAFDGEQLIMSDGSDQLKFMQPRDFEVTRTVTVHSGEKTYGNLNELEYANGLVWANVWRQTQILGIDPSTGEVKVVIDVASLQREAATRSGESVANGIAFDKQRDGFWLTGKYWRYRYFVRWAPG